MSSSARSRNNPTAALHPIRSRPRTVIVGAGPGGLAAAMLAAHAGFEVTVLERAAQVGGRTSTIVHDGYRFDRGPTFFLFPEVLDEIFATCGRSLEDEVDLIRLDTHYRLVYGGGGHLDVTADRERLKAEIARIAPADAAGLDSFLQENRAKLSAFRPVLQREMQGLGDLLKLPLAQLLPLLRPFSSVERDLERHFSDPRIRLAFSFQSKYLGMSPFKCPSLFTILSFLEHEYGVFHPRGGCAAVSEAMARVAREMGVDIRLGEAVESLEMDGRRPVAVRTGSGRYACDSLVINADFAQAMRRLVPGALRRRWSDRRLDRAKYSCSTFMLYLGLEGRWPELGHHTIYLADDYRGNLADIDTRHRLTDDPSFYVCNPSVTDPSMAPPGGSSLYVLVPVTHRHENVDWNVEAPRFRERVLDQLGKIGLGDVRPRIRFEKMVTPADWESQLLLERGATFSLAHSFDQMLHRRPNNRFEELDGVYLVGGGTHPGSGLPVIYESARISSRLMAADFGLRVDWSAPAAAPAVALAEVG